MSNEIPFDEIYEEEENFIRKLKKGTSKDKGNLPMKCFNCRKIGYFSPKYLIPKQNYSDDEGEPIYK